MLVGVFGAVRTCYVNPGKIKGYWTIGFYRGSIEKSRFRGLGSLGGHFYSKSDENSDPKASYNYSASTHGGFSFVVVFGTRNLSHQGFGPTRKDAWPVLQD